MKRYNYTAKSARCLTCANYMYGCGGCISNEEAHKCDEYDEDLNAYVRQDNDETYIASVDQLSEDIDQAINVHNQYKTKTYIYDIDNELLITICYTTEAPKVDEDIILHRECIFENYKVSKRILGINTDNGAAVWNLYVKKI